MGVSAAVGFASQLADRAVDAYRFRLLAQVERRRLETLQLNMLVSGSLAAVGMVVDVAALQLRVHNLQQALDEATQAGDLHAAEQLRGQLVATLQEPPASARLLQTLAEYIPALMVRQNGGDARVIEGQVV
jgi:hypothetical protein